MNGANATSNFIRLGGFVTILAGGLMVLADIWHTIAGLLIADYTGSATEEIGSTIFLAGRALIVFGIPSLYLYQAHAAAKFGVVAFVILMLGNTLMVGPDWSEVFVSPILRSLILISLLPLSTNLPRPVRWFGRIMTFGILLPDSFPGFLLVILFSTPWSFLLGRWMKRLTLTPIEAS
jgi:hypothetical protein